MGFVVTFRLLEVPVNPPPRDVIHSCDVPEHSTVGIAPPAPTGCWEEPAPILAYLRASQKSHPWLIASECPCQPPQLGRDGATGRTVVPAATTHSLSLKAIRQLHYPPHSKAAAKAPEQTGTAPLAGDWTQAVSCKYALHHLSDAFSGGSCVLCALRTAGSDHIHGAELQKGSCGEQLNNWNTPCPVHDKAYLEEIFVNNPVLNRKCKPLISLSQDWFGWKAKPLIAPMGMHHTPKAGTSTTKTQLNSTGRDQGSRTLNEPQMVLRDCKGNNREGTNGRVACVYTWNVCFLCVCLDCYGFEFLCKTKVTEAEFSADCGTRVPTRGALREGRLEVGEKPLRRRGFKKHWV